MLSNLGRREEALSAADEAVRLYRALAASRPDAFGVDLARSLWVLGDLHGETGNSDLAVERLAEGVRHLTPIFAAVPAAVAGLMGGLVQSYLRQCKAPGDAPDEELLRPVIAEFERLNATEEKMSGSGDNRSVTARDITGSSLVTGDHDTVTTTMRQVAAPPADKVDVQTELAALKELLAQLKNVPDRGKLDRAMQDAVEETAKSKPDKEEVGGALERVVKYAKGASDFAENTEKLIPRLAALGSWLGPAGRAVLNTLGVSI
jgi:hypothetical protein